MMTPLKTFCANGTKIYRSSAGKQFSKVTLSSEASLHHKWKGLFDYEHRHPKGQATRPESWGGKQGHLTVFYHVFRMSLVSWLLVIDNQFDNR
jgi:hypothetical protein